MATKRHEKSRELSVDKFLMVKDSTCLIFVSLCAFSWLHYFFFVCAFAGTTRLSITSPVLGRLSKPTLRCTDCHE
jgi:hypothetical protein